MEIYFGPNLKDPTRARAVNQSMVTFPKVSKRSASQHSIEEEPQLKRIHLMEWRGQNFELGIKVAVYLDRSLKFGKR